MKTTLTTTILLLFTQFGFAQPTTKENEDFWMEIIRPVNERVFALVIDAELNLIAGMGSGKGVHLSNNNGETWQPIGLENLSIYSLHVHQNGNVFAGTGGSYNIHRLINIEEGWIPLFSATSNIISIMHTYSGDLHFGFWGGIYKSTDNGDTWTQTLEISNAKEVASIIETADGTMFAGITAWSVPGGGVYRSMDNGDSWEQSGLPNKYIRSLAVNSQGDIFAGSIGDHSQYYGGLYKSSDNGQTWVELRNDVLVTSIVITPYDNIYFGSNEYGDKAGVFFSNDNGETWERFISGLIGPGNQKIEGLSLAPDGYLYAYGNHLHRSVEPVLSSNSIHQPDVIQAIIYPNPFSENINIVLPDVFQDFSSVNIFIYDSLGKSVFKQKSTGKYNLGLNLSFLNPGIYYVVIEIYGQRFSKPAIKQ
ncbi:MAG: T9SS type A sorting domain-containing protein [Bacteroidota bacterium]